MKLLTFIICIASITLFALDASADQGNFPDIIEFNGSPDGGGKKGIYPSTYTGPVEFQHRKHQVEYKLQCSDCHHSSDAAKIMREGSTESIKCENCHNKKGLVRGPIAENAISDEELITHRANALHLLCRGCHKKHNATEHVVKAPEACRTCHAKRSQDWVLED